MKYSSYLLLSLLSSRLVSAAPVPVATDIETVWVTSVHTYYHTVVIGEDGLETPLDVATSQPASTTQPAEPAATSSEPEFTVQTSEPATTTIPTTVETTAQITESSFIAPSPTVAAAETTAAPEPTSAPEPAPAPESTSEVAASPVANYAAPPVSSVETTSAVVPASTAAPTTSSTTPATSTAPATSSSAPSSSPSGTEYSGEGTYYNPSMGSCGGTNSDDDLIVAISKDRIQPFNVDNNPNKNPLCGRKIRASYEGKSVDVTVVDTCMGCKYNDLDLSPSAFAKIADLGLGRINLQWSWL